MESKATSLAEALVNSTITDVDLEDNNIGATGASISRSLEKIQQLELYAFMRIILEIQELQH